MTFITTILRLNMEITQNDYSPTLTLLHIKLRSKFLQRYQPRYIEKWFDTSNYPTSHPSGIKIRLNSKVLGMFKDEAGGK